MRFASFFIFDSGHVRTAGMWKLYIILWLRLSDGHLSAWKYFKMHISVLLFNLLIRNCLRLHHKATRLNIVPKNAYALDTLRLRVLSLISNFRERYGHLSVITMGWWLFLSFCSSEWDCSSEWEDVLKQSNRPLPLCWSLNCSQSWWE